MSDLFKILVWNCHSLYNKLGNFKVNIYCYKPHVICLTETWLKDNRKPSFINYSSYLINRNGGSGGGIAILIRNDLMFRKKDLVPYVNGKLDIQAVTIYSNKKYFDIMNLYNPNLDISLDEFNHYFNQLSNTHIITGDFNAHENMWDTIHPPNITGKNLAESLLNFNSTTLLTPQNLPTYYHQATNSYSTLDLTFVSVDLFPMSRVLLGEDLGSDHEPIRVEIAFKVQEIQGRRRPKWKFEPGSWDQWRQALPPITITGQLLPDISTFQNALLDTGMTTFKMTKENIKIKYSKPWWTEECAQVIRAKHKARNIFRKHPTNQNYENFKIKDNEATSVIKKSKSISFRHFCNQLSSESPIKLVWNCISAFSQKYKPPKPTILIENDNVVTDPELKSNIMANHLKKIFKCKDSERNGRYIIPIAMALSDDSDHISYNKDFNLPELNLALSTLKSTSPGFDNVHNEMLKNLPCKYKTILLAIFNHSFNLGIVPTCWKTSIILPFLKEGKNPTEVTSYRPISLLPACSKLLEKLVFNRLNIEIESKLLLRPSQGGFRRRLCTIDQISSLEYSIRNSLANQKITVVVFIDLEKAFDSVWHIGLVNKIQNLGIKGRMLRWLKSYLSGRKFRVYWEGIYSSEQKISSGVPQGAILSPLLFNIMLNDIPVIENVSSAEYADDISFYMQGENMVEIVHTLQNQLTIFSEWASEWGLNINIPKCKAMFFTRKKVSPPQMYLNNIPIAFVPTHRYLGMVLDSPKLFWHRHIDYLKSSSVQRINILKAVSGHHWGADRSVLTIMYKSLIRSRLDYGCTLYDSTSYTHSSKLDKIQNKCLRIITGAQATSPILSIEVESNFPPLEIHRKYLLLKFIYRIAELPPHVSIGKNTNDCIQLLKRRPWLALQNQPPAIIRAIDLNLQLKLSPIEYSPISLTTPLYPCINMNDHFSTEFSAHSVKDLTNEMTRQIFQHIDSQHPHYIKIFTDGSKIFEPDVSCGAAVIVQRGDTTEMLNFRLSPDTSIMGCELHAISEALDYIKTFDGPQTNFIIYTDSMSSIQLLKEQKNRSYLYYAFKIYQQIAKILSSGANVKLQFIPGHKNIEGNELADLVANSAHSLDLQGTGIPKEDRVSKMHAILYKYWETKWLNLIDITNKGTHLKQIKGKVGHWPWSLHKNRNVETVMAKLRIGHANFKEHQFRFNLSPTPLCNCGEFEDIEHFMLFCPIYRRQRQNLVFKLNNMSVPINLKNLLGGGNFNESVQFKIIEYVSDYLKSIKKLYIL